MTRSFTTMGAGSDRYDGVPSMPITHAVSEGLLLREDQTFQQQQQQPRYTQQQLQRSRTPGPETMMRPNNQLTTSMYPSAAALVDNSQRVQQAIDLNQSFQSAMAGLSIQPPPPPHPGHQSALMNSPRQASPYQEFSISLRRFESGFGFRLIGGREESSQISVGHIVEDGAAACDGRLRTNDEIIAIDGTPILGASHSLAVQLMAEAKQRGIVTLSLRRHYDSNPQQQLHLTLPRQPLSPNKQLSTPPTPPQPLQAAQVILQRHDDEGFGFVVVSSVNRNGSSIGHIIENSPAARCNQLRVGDRILAINNCDTSTLNHGDVINLIKESGQTLRLTILPSNDLPYSPKQIQPPPRSSNADLIYSSNTLPRQFSPPTSQQSGFSSTSIQQPQFELVAVELHRGARGFGFSIRGGREFGGMPLYVLRIADGGAASLDGRLQVGDEILEINGESAVGMTHARAIDLIQSGGSQVVKLVVRRFRKTDT